ncbi:MAG TPA: CarD family transcriptional regulator, partial [Sulfurimonas sp.]
MSQNRLFQYYKTSKDQDLEILICQDSKEAHSLESVAKFFQKDVLVFPDLRATFGDDLRVYKEEIHELFSALRKYYSLKKKPLIIAPLKTLLFNLPKESLLSSTTLEFGSTLELKKFQEQMLFWGYSFVDMVQVEGEISFRGDIIDIFPPSSAMPLRISLFDDEIEQIKYFELESQRTQKDELEKIEITPAFYSLNEDEFNTLNEKVSKSEFNSLVKDIASLGLWHLDESAANFLEGKDAKLVRNLDAFLIDAYALNKPTLSRECFNLEVLDESDDYKEISVTDINALLKVHKDKKITLIASNEAVVKQAGLFDLKGIDTRYAPYILNILTKDELVISLNKPDRIRRRRKSSILLDDLKAGDYVVHEDYGVGIFESIEKTEILGGIKDFIVIKYVGDDKILLPVENLDVIDRYIASGGSVPVLDKLGKGSFGKLKESVKKRLMEIAGQIVNTAAARELIKAPKISVDEDELRAFQKLSGFEYTDDQTQSISEIITQMSSGHIMDRLLSGDVGFGKTEVAMNTIFAAYKSGYQSALIVPTTLLSAQHYRSLHERFDELGIKCSKLDRFVSAKDKKNITKALASGDLDVVVGTHALF